MNASRRLAAVVAGLWLCLGPVPRVPAADRFDSVYLSEFLADNRQGLMDADGTPQPWIELHNARFQPVHLGGWFLTDTPTNLTRWRLPGYVLPPDKYLVVFASGKNRATNLAELHTNFRLDPRGNYLALVDPRTNVVSEFSSTPQQPGVSDGRVRGEPGLRGYFPRPTPGRANAASGPGFAPEITFSPAGGSFLEPVQLRLATTPAATGVVIRYTLDGSLPNRTSPAYAAPLLLTNASLVRARAYQPGRLPGPPRTESYLRLHTNAAEFSSTLPVLVMETFGRESRVSANSTHVHLSLFEPAGGRTSLTNRPAFTTRAGFHARGSSSAGMPQTPFSLGFLDEFNEDRPLAWLGLPADSDWVLYAPNAYDPVLIHNPFIHQLSRDLGRYSPRTRFIEVFLVRSAGRIRSAHYHGLYVLEEKIRIGKQRVNIDRPGPNDLAPPEVTGGYLLKFDRLGPGEQGLFNTGDRGLVYVEPKEQTMLLPQRAPQRRYLQQYFRDFERALHGPGWLDPVKGYRAFFDVPAGIDFHILEVLSGNVDAIVLSTYFHKPRNGKITFGPHWDFDRALGSTDGRDANPRQWRTGQFFADPWWGRLCSDPDFWQAWIDRWQELRQAQLSPARLNQLIDELAAGVREAQPRQYRRWGLQARGGSYQAEVDHMKNWLAERADFLDDEFTAPPRVEVRPLERGTSTITLQAGSTNAVIHYTLDGTDPRAAQGVLAAGALTYDRPLILTNGARLVARVRDPTRRQNGETPVSSSWSGPVRIPRPAGRTGGD